MYIEEKIESYFLIRCEKCGELLKKHKMYCKQYGEEYWFHKQIECSCGSKAKVLRWGKSNSVVQKKSDNLNSISDKIPIHEPTHEKLNTISDRAESKQCNNKIELLKKQSLSLNIEIENLKKQNIEFLLENKRLKRQIELYEKHDKLLKDEIIEYKSVLTDAHFAAIDINKHVENLNKKEELLLKKNLNLENQIKDNSKYISSLHDEIIVLEDEVLYQSFGLYTPIYDFAKAEDYKERINQNRVKQKNMLRTKSAIHQPNRWDVNGSKSLGTKMANDIIKQVLRCFNSECEYIINRVKFNNFNNMYDRITKSFDTLNKLNYLNGIEIKKDYLELKYEELRLGYEYELKKQTEKEELRELREQKREEAKLIREIEERKKELEKEQQHYNNALKRLNEQIEIEKSETRKEFLFEKQKEIENNLTEIDKVIEDIDFREANYRAGYVYVISNIGAFGENVYKIGMTRRLEPQDRVDELGSASVPFKFDIHAMIFSDNAPKLENALHKAFEDRKINMMNNRKEFFYVTLEEIETIIKANHDKTVEFINIAPAQQYRESLKLKEIRSNDFVSSNCLNIELE